MLRLLFALGVVDERLKFKNLGMTDQNKGNYGGWKALGRVLVVGELMGVSAPSE